MAGPTEPTSTETKADVFAALLAEWRVDEYQIDSEWGVGDGAPDIAIQAAEWSRRYAEAVE